MIFISIFLYKMILISIFNFYQLIFISICQLVNLSICQFERIFGDFWLVEVIGDFVWKIFEMKCVGLFELLIKKGDSAWFEMKNEAKWAKKEAQEWKMELQSL